LEKIYKTGGYYYITFTNIDERGSRLSPRQQVGMVLEGSSNHHNILMKNTVPSHITKIHGCGSGSGRIPKLFAGSGFGYGKIIPYPE
jgi:hypothetical protein